jgi:hypothetical protein
VDVCAGGATWKLFPGKGASDATLFSRRRPTTFGFAFHDNCAVENRFVIVSIEERLQQWHAAETSAREAEGAIAKCGQGAADPQFKELLLRAQELRLVADRQLAAILRAVNQRDDTEQASYGDGQAGPPESSSPPH